MRHFLHYNRDPDLLTKYFIYKNRKCDDIKLHFSKNKILSELQNKYDLLYVDYYNQLLSLYLYIRCNLMRFPVFLPKNIFVNYGVTIDNEVQVFDGPVITYENLMTLLYEQVDKMYEQLIDQINKLD